MKLHEIGLSAKGRKASRRLYQETKHYRNFPHWQRHGVTLAARADAPAGVERILESGCRFYGYDPFIVSGETIQPVPDFSPDWSRRPVPRSHAPDPSTGPQGPS